MWCALVGLLPVAAASVPGLERRSYVIDALASDRSDQPFSEAVLLDFSVL
jgi:hypothetical protein